MPRLRRLSSTALAATVALPLATVAIAVPAAAADWPAPGWSRGYAYGWSNGQSYGGQSYGGQSYGYGAPYGSQQYPSTTAASDTSVATATQEVGLVEVSTVIDYGEGEAAGTGMVIGSDGIVVTNHHVVQGATSIKVTVVSTGQTYTADLVGDSARKDVAVLRLEGASGLTTVTTDASGTLTDAAVTSVGDAGGDGGALTAAAGTVTARHQKITVTEDDGSTARLRGLIEVDADIVPGDSGGALRESDGDVVGMNVAASSGGPVTGYVIPIARVLRVADAVLAGETPGDVTLGYSAFLGVELRGTSLTLAGVVADGPAASAGLAAGDTVTALGGTAVSTGAELRRAVASHQPGDSVSVSWTDASGAVHTATVTLDQAPVA
jgi:S1-C subfamily serine protease